MFGILTFGEIKFGILTFKRMKFGILTLRRMNSGFWTIIVCVYIRRYYVVGSRKGFLDFLTKLLYLGSR